MKSKKKERKMKKLGLTFRETKAETFVPNFFSNEVKESIPGPQMLLHAFLITYFDQVQELRIHVQSKALEILGPV